MIDYGKTPESRARVTALAEELCAAISTRESVATPDSAMLARAKARHDQVFPPTLNYLAARAQADMGGMVAR